MTVSAGSRRVAGRESRKLSTPSSSSTSGAASCGGRGAVTHRETSVETTGGTWPGVADQDETARDLAQEHEVAPRELPRLLDEDDVERHRGRSTRPHFADGPDGDARRRRKPLRFDLPRDRRPEIDHRPTRPRESNRRDSVLRRAFGRCRPPACSSASRRRRASPSSAPPAASRRRYGLPGARTAP